MRWGAIALASLSLTACAKSGLPDSSALQTRQQELNRIAAQCGVAADTLELISESQVTFSSKFNERPISDSAFSCLLAKFEKATPPLNLGFVGRESILESKQ